MARVCTMKSWECSSTCMGNTVSFKGSSNETWSGWHNQGNFESIEVFCSWRGAWKRGASSVILRLISNLWSEEDPDVSVTPFPATVEEYIKRWAAKRLDDLLTEPTKHSTPRRSPLEHQLAAIAAWRPMPVAGFSSTRRAVGETFTALMAIKKHCSQGLPAIVLVPSRLLLEQWAKEIRDEIPEAARTPCRCRS